MVLGAQIHKTGPSVVLRYRLDTAREYLEDNDGTLCIVTGGQGYNEPYPEAIGMKEYLISHGVDEERILLETKSKNTKENLKNAKEMFDPDHDQVGIVTNNFHVFRALSLARKEGIRNCCGISAGFSLRESVTDGKRVSAQDLCNADNRNAGYVRRRRHSVHFSFFYLVYAVDERQDFILDLLVDLQGLFTGRLV